MIVFINEQNSYEQSLKLALRLEEAGFNTSLISQQQHTVSIPEYISSSDAVILIISPDLILNYSQYRHYVEYARQSKKTILALLNGMSRAEFNTKQTDLKNVIGKSATLQIDDENIGNSIPKLVSALKGIGIQPESQVDMKKILSIRQQLKTAENIEQADAITSQKSEATKTNSTVFFAVFAVIIIAVIGYFVFFSKTAITQEYVVLKIHGSNTIGAKLAPALIEAFMQNRGFRLIEWKQGENREERLVKFSHPDSVNHTVIELFAHGSTSGFRDLARGKCDIGLSSRPIKEEEAVILRSKNFGVMTNPSNEHVIGLDGLAIIVHPSNPISHLTIEQVAKIFYGSIANWKSINGNDALIRLYARDSLSGTAEIFHQLVLKKIKVNTISADAKFFEDSNELSSAVAADPNAIGFVGFVYIKDSKPVAISDNTNTMLFPNAITIGREDYPLVRRLYMYTSSNPHNKLVQEFVRFAMSGEGQNVVRYNDFVDLNISSENKPALTNTASQAYKDVVENFKRLSVNFRYQKDNDQLDSKAYNDIDRLVSYVKEKGYPELKLIGFNANENLESDNIRLSLHDAQMVQRELRSRGIDIDNANVIGLGSELPLASGKSDEAKTKNRRVEVWVK